MFEICDNKGFRVTFDNDVTVSVQFGGGNYCDNYDSPIGTQTRGMSSGDAEVAILRKGEWLTREYDPELTDDVMGRVTPDKVLDILNWAKNHK